MAGHRLRIVFHWVTILLVVAAYAIIFYRTRLDDPDQRLFWLDCHRLIGLTILSLTFLRLLGRWLLPFEKIHEAVPILRWAARANHAALYVGLVAMPLLGWAQSSAKMRKFKLFGIKIHSLVHHDSDLGDVLGQWHENLAWILLALIGMHSVAALYHHFVRRDRVLVNMLSFQPAER